VPGALAAFAKFSGVIDPSRSWIVVSFQLKINFETSFETSFEISFETSFEISFETSFETNWQG
jgi:hypothetical protein